ncbi:hypothetical protein ACEN9J_36775 [Variovorax sp. Varisp41]|uniref:hypothetical protein n=1 Tax=Variovorax sp. Varisp41 TaxID=3243033 RepID=UPI0039B38DE1
MAIKAASAAESPCRQRSDARSGRRDAARGDGEDGVCPRRQEKDIQSMNSW